MLFALTASVILGLIGTAVDFGRSRNDHSTLSAALDAAVLAAAQAVKAADARGASDVQARQAGLDAGTKMFNAFPLSAASPRLQLEVTINGRAVGVVGSFQAATKTTLLGLASIPQVPISGRASASLDLSPFVDIYLLIDVSGSMAIGATKADIDALNANLGCAFACHDGSPVKGTSLDSYQWAKANGITLRLQEVNKGITDFVTWLQAQAATSKRVRVSIYAFSTNLTRVLEMTSNLAQVRTNLPQTPSASGETDGATLWGQTMNQFIPLVGAGGDGVTAPRKLVIIATDGAADPGRSWTRQSWMRWWVAPFDPSYCATLKAVNPTTKQGVSVGVLHTPYLPLPSDWGYNATLGQPSQIGGPGTRADDIPGQLTACASAGLYINASKSRSFGEAMQRIFTTFSQVRLTN
ncbi:pilus assembly protein TadG-related protein [Methylobacterium crusticola]|uniref:pilus assembly protein TadG-related protein n=1 Tax=Methylobacterium crusticola TaxID=1697972 RepID=UPI00139677A2|nr:pilus assembly protein TadG-related protein [Methylobacterium crusticola]